MGVLEGPNVSRSTAVFVSIKMNADAFFDLTIDAIVSRQLRSQEGAPLRTVALVVTTRSIELPAHTVSR